MKKIFITGGAGFIGSHLIEELNSSDIKPIVYDNLSTGKIENLNGLNYDFIESDILNYDFLLQSMENCEYIFHLAAATSVIESMENPEKYIDVNSIGTLNVLKAARESGAEKVLLASSAAIYGDSLQLPKTEEMRPEPKSAYAISKLDGEYFCELYNESYNLSTAITRFFNVFGERQDPNSPYAAAIPIFLSRIYDDKEIQIFGDGEQTRDFVYVKDIVKSLVFLMENSSGIYNIGYGKSISVNQLIELLKEYTGREIKLKYVDERAGEIKHSYASVEKLMNEGFEPSFSIEEGLRLTVDKWKEM